MQAPLNDRARHRERLETVIAEGCRLTDKIGATPPIHTPANPNPAVYPLRPNTDKSGGGNKFPRFLRVQERRQVPSGADPGLRFPEASTLLAIAVADDEKRVTRPKLITECRKMNTASQRG